MLKSALPKISSLFVSSPAPLTFFFSCLGTLGVWPRTLPARAREPCTLPAGQRGRHNTQGDSIMSAKHVQILAVCKAAAAKPSCTKATISNDSAAALRLPPAARGLAGAAAAGAPRWPLQFQLAHIEPQSVRRAPRTAGDPFALPCLAGAVAPAGGCCCRPDCLRVQHGAPLAPRGAAIHAARAPATIQPLLLRSPMVAVQADPRQVWERVRPLRAPVLGPCGPCCPLQTPTVLWSFSGPPATATITSCIPHVRRSSLGSAGAPCALLAVSSPPVASARRPSLQQLRNRIYYATAHRSAPL